MPSRDDILANITTGPGRPSRGDILAGMTGGAQGPLVDLVKGSKATPQRTPITTAELFPRAAPVALPPAPEPEPGPFEFAGPLGKFIDLIDTPRAAIVSTIKETGDLFRGEGFSPTDWWKQTEGNLFMQDVMRDWGVDLPGPLDMVVGLGFDIAFDPITYMTGGIGAAGRAGMNAPKLIKAMSRGASYYDDIAKAGGKAGVTATQAQHKAGVLKQAVLDVGKSNAMNAASREALQEVGLLGQMGLFVPATGRLGRGLRLDKVLDKATRGGVMARRARQASRLPYIDDLARPVAGRTLDDATEAVARFGREGLEDAAAAEAKILERMKMIAGREALPDIADDFYTAAARMAARMPVEAVRLPGFTGKVLSSTVPQFGKAKANLMGRKPVEMIDTAFNTRSSIKEGLRSGDYETVLGANKAMTSNSAGWAARNRFMDVMSKSALQMRRRARKLGMSEDVVDDLWKTELWDFAPGSKAPRVGVDGLPVMNPMFRQKFGVYMEQAGEAAITDFWGQGRKWMDDALVNANILGGSNWLSASADELWVMRLALESATDPTAARTLIPGAEFRGVPLLSQVDDPLKRTVEEQIRAIANSELGDGAEELFDRNIWRAMDRYLSKIGEGVRRAKVMNLLEEQGVVFKEPLAWIKGQVDEGYDALRGLYGNRGDAFNQVFRAIEQGFDAEQVKAMRMAAAARDGASKMGEQTAAWVAEVELLESRLVEIQARLVDKMTDVAGQARRSSDALGEFMKPLLQEASVLGYRYAQLQAISRALTMQRKAMTPTITDQKLLDDLTVGFGNVQAALKAVMEDAKSVAKMDKTVDAIKDMIEALQVPLRDLDTQGLLDGVEPGMRDWISKALDIRENIAELGVEYLDLSGISLEKLPRWFSEVQDSWQDVSAAYQGAVDRGYGQTTAMNEWRRRQALAGGILLGEESPFVRLEATLRDGVWSRRVSGGAMVSEGEPLKWSAAPLEAPSLTARSGERAPKYSIPSEKELLTKYRSVTNVDEATHMTLQERQALRLREAKEWTDAGKHVTKKPGKRFGRGQTAMSAREVGGRRQIDTWHIEPTTGDHRFGEGLWSISVNGEEVAVGRTLKEAKLVAQAEATKRGGLAPVAREVAAEAVTPPPAAAVAAPPADWPRYKHFTTAESKAGLVETGGAFDPSLPAAHGIMGREGEWIYDQPGMAGRRLYLSLDDARWRDVEGGPAGLESVEYAIDPKARVLVLDSEAALRAVENEMKGIDLVYHGERAYDEVAKLGYDVVEIRNVARNSQPDPGMLDLTAAQRFFEATGGDQIIVLNNDVVRFAPEGAPSARQVAAEAVTPPPAAAAAEVVTPPPGVVTAHENDRVREVKGWVQAYERTLPESKRWNQVRNDVAGDVESFLAGTEHGWLPTPGKTRAGRKVGEYGRLGASEEEVLVFVEARYPLGKGVGPQGDHGAPLHWPVKKPWDAEAQRKYAKKLRQYVRDMFVSNTQSGVARMAGEAEAEAASAVAARRAVARRKVFSACTGDKCPMVEGATVAAEDLYTGETFKFMRRRIDASDAELGGIISAKYGVLDPTELVGSYDVKLPKSGAKRVIAGPDQLHKFVALVGDAEELFFYGPVMYRALMRDLLQRAQSRGLLGRHIRVVEAKGGIGDIKGSLGTWAGEGSAAPRILEIPAEGPVWRGLGGYKKGDAYELGEGAFLQTFMPPGSTRESDMVAFRIRRSKGKAGGWTVWYKREGMEKFARIDGGGNVRIPAKSNPDKTVMVAGVWKTLEDAKASVADELVEAVAPSRTRKQIEEALEELRLSLEGATVSQRLRMVQKRIDLEADLAVLGDEAVEAVTPPPAAGAIHPDFVDEAARIETMVADEQVKAGEAAWAAGDRVYVAGPKGGPVFDEVIVRTPFGDFQLRFIGKKKGRRVQVVKAPAALKDAPAKTGPKKGGTRVPLGDGVEFQDYDTARETIGRWAEEVYETRWSGKGIVEKGAEAEVAQGAVGRLLQDPARQGGVRQALASLTGRTETTGFYGVKGLSWIDEPLWRMPLDQKMAFTEVERRLLTDAERLNHLAYAEEHYRNAESAMQQGLEAEAQIAAMQGRLRQLQAEKAVMKEAGAKEGAMVPELYDGRRTDLDLFQEDLRKFNAVRTRDLFGEALTEQTAAQWGPNTAQAGWSQGWSAPLQGEESAPMFEMLNALFKTSSTVGDFEGFLKWYDKFLNYWKAQAVSTPGFVLRNGLGGSWLSYAFGLMELGSTNKFAGTYFRAIRGGKGDAVAGIDDMIAKLLGSGKKTVGVGFGSRVDVNELRTIRRVLDSGIVGGGQVITEVDRSVAMRLVKESRNPITGNPIDVVFNPASTEFAPFRFIRSTNEQMETVLRGALAFDVMQKGGSVGEAAGQVYKFHFNYADLTATERKARRIIPFWTWQKNVVPILVESLGKNPVAWGRLQQVKGNMELQSKEEGVVPDYFLENMAIRLPWKINEYQAYWIPDLPFRDLNRLMKEPGSITRVFAESAAPPVKVPLEIWAGKQFFADLPFSGRYQQVPHVYDKFPFLMQALALAGKAKKDRKGEYKMRDQDLYMLDSWMPFLSRFRRLLPNESRYSRRVVSTVVSTVFGTQVRINDPHETRNQMLRDDRAFDEKMRDLIDIEMRVR